MKKIIFLILIFNGFQAFAQKKLEIDGRIQGMPTYITLNKNNLSIMGINNNQILTYTELNNRINLRWYPINKLNLEAGIRNNYSFGNMIYQINCISNNLYNKYLISETGWVNLTKTWHEDINGVLYTNVDRLFANLELGKLNVKTGRQRINWGIGMVWQPNDIFNSFNYLNFNYPERPGSDAIRIQYYTGYTSGFDLAYKIDNQDRSSYAMKYAFNQWDYDWQAIAGVMNQDYYMAGLGWSGDIKGAGFSGEISYFKPITNDANFKETILVSISANYTFQNSLFINFSALYNSKGTTKKAGRGFFSMIDNITVLDYTLSKAEFFGQIAYPLTPLINIDLSSIVNPFDGSFYLGPSVRFSLTDNVSFNLIAQTFFGEKGTEYGDFGKMFFGQLTWNFSN